MRWINNIDLSTNPTNKNMLQWFSILPLTESNSGSFHFNKYDSTNCNILIAQTPVGNSYGDWKTNYTGKYRIFIFMVYV